MPILFSALFAKIFGQLGFDFQPGFQTGGSHIGIDQRGHTDDRQDNQHDQSDAAYHHKYGIDQYPEQLGGA